MPEQKREEKGATGDEPRPNPELMEGRLTSTFSSVAVEDL